ncbi:MAG: hypothetical protein O2884_09935 [Chloroflexi bacterium]|nr:hypothetical protein [Chloroflexota bacterium]
MFDNRFHARLKNSLLAISSLLFLLLMAACGGGTPEDVSFDLTIADGAVAGGNSTFVADQGDTVTLNLTSDVHGNALLHGYDLKLDVGPDQPSTMTFLADATGRFSIEFHAAADDGHDDHDHDHGAEDFTLGALEIRPR